MFRMCVRRGQPNNNRFKRVRGVSLGALLFFPFLLLPTLSSATFLLPALHLSPLSYFPPEVLSQKDWAQMQEKKRRNVHKYVRWRHLAGMENHFGQLNSDFGVVNGGRNHCCARKKTLVSGFPLSPFPFGNRRKRSNSKIIKRSRKAEP